MYCPRMSLSFEVNKFIKSALALYFSIFGNLTFNVTHISVHRFCKWTLSAFLSLKCLLSSLWETKARSSNQRFSVFFHESYQARQVKPLCWMGEDFWTCKTGDTPAPGSKTKYARPDRGFTNHISVLRISLRSHYTIFIVQRSITFSK